MNNCKFHRLCLNYNVWIFNQFQIIQISELAYIQQFLGTLYVSILQPGKSTKQQGTDANLQLQNTKGIKLQVLRAC